MPRHLPKTLPSKDAKASQTSGEKNFPSPQNSEPLCKKKPETSLENLLEDTLHHYLQAFLNVDFSQISEEKKASMGLSLLEKLLKGMSTDSMDSFSSPPDGEK